LNSKFIGAQMVTLTGQHVKNANAILTAEQIVHAVHHATVNLVI
jgi:hypothetical protein